MSCTFRTDALPPTLRAWVDTAVITVKSCPTANSIACRHGDVRVTVHAEDEGHCRAVWMTLESGGKIERVGIEYYLGYGWEPPRTFMGRPVVAV